MMLSIFWLQLDPLYDLGHELQSAHVEQVTKNQLDPKMILHWDYPGRQLGCYSHRQYGLRA